MEQTRHQVFKSLVNIILFIALFISFLVLYFINETNDYLKASTTFASRTEQVDKFSLPVLVVCIEPSYKPSIYGNGSADLSIILEKEKSIKKEQKLSDFLKSASYKLNEDIQIELIMYDDNNNIAVKHNLEDGQKVMDNFQIDVYQTQTLKYGFCYLIESGEIVSPEVSFDVIVKDLNSNNSNKLSKMNLFVASPETWYGIISLSWPYFELEMHSFSFDIPNTYYWMDMSVTSISYQKGHESVENCIENWKITNDECKKCSPLFFSFQNKMPSCQSYEDNRCWYHWSFIEKTYSEYKKCLKPMKSTLYETKSVPFEKASNQSNVVELRFGYLSDEINIKEETLMMETSSYIGSVGGSLGLFLGFSFFTYLSCFIDKLLSVLKP
mgnify:CR=1 FL=1